ncbi:MAG: hypothetical protein AB8B55_09695 [Mariniblastus sp.]
MSTGYSGTPLSKKLGIKPHMKVTLVDAPDHATELIAPLPDGVTLAKGVRCKADIALVFCRTEAALKKRVKQLWKLAFPDRMIWICWPKKSGSLFVDLTEGAIRKHVLDLGLVDVKVCAVDADWSGLKFVVRKELRSE